MEIKVTEEFKQLFDLLENKNHNVVLFGSAGTGKSTFIKWFEQKSKKKILFLSPTGIAALNIGGTTIHSFFGFPFKPLTPHDITRPKQYKINILKSADIIVIDEISMLKPDILDAISWSLQINLSSPKPFAGKQIVLIGDLFQLPPVVNKEVEFFYRTSYATPYFFSSRKYLETHFDIFNLTHIFRQEDKEFIGHLNEIRLLKPTYETFNYFNKRYTACDDKDILTITSFVKTADYINEKKLNELPNEAQTYDAFINGNFNVKQMLTPEKLTLKVGAKVMFTKNDKDDRFKNGTFGIVKRLGINDITVEIENGLKTTITREKWIAYDYVWDETGKRFNEVEKGSFEQFPLMLGYAVTIHKCVEKNTYINLKNKNYEMIKETQENDLIKDGQGEYNKIKYKSIPLLKSGYKITTKCGYSLICGAEHPILINDGKNQYFKKIKDINNNDYVCIDRSITDNKNDYYFQMTEKRGKEILNLYLPTKMDKEFAWFLGYLIGNGNYNDKRGVGRIEITTMNFDFVIKIQNLLKKIGLNVKIRTQRVKHIYYSIYFHSTQFLRFLSENGLKCVTAKEKEIPSCIFKSNNECRAAFLRGIFDADGSASNNMVRYVSASKILIEQMKILLLGFGIISYQLLITNNNICLHIVKTSLNNFYKYIGFCTDYKQKLLKQMAEKQSVKTSLDFIPDGKIIISDIKKYIQENIKNTKGKINQGIYSAKYNISKVKTIFGQKFRFATYFHLDYIKHILDTEKMDYKNTLFYDRLQKHYFYDKILKIEKLENKVEMYDIEVENNNSFFANGFVAHNSQGQTYNKAKIDLGTGAFASGQLYVALSRCTNYNNIYLASPIKPSDIIQNRDILSWWNQNVECKK